MKMHCWDKLRDEIPWLIVRYNNRDVFVYIVMYIFSVESGDFLLFSIFICTHIIAGFYNNKDAKRLSMMTPANKNIVGT